MNRLSLDVDFLSLLVGFSLLFSMLSFSAWFHSIFPPPLWRISKTHSPPPSHLPSPPCHPIPHHPQQHHPIAIIFIIAPLLPFLFFQSLISLLPPPVSDITHTQVCNFPHADESYTLPEMHLFCFEERGMEDVERKIEPETIKILYKTRRKDLVKKTEGIRNSGKMGQPSKTREGKTGDSA